MPFIATRDSLITYSAVTGPRTGRTLHTRHKKTHKVSDYSFFLSVPTNSVPHCHVRTLPTCGIITRIDVDECHALFSAQMELTYILKYVSESLHNCHVLRKKWISRRYCTIETFMHLQVLVTIKFQKLKWSSQINTFYRFVYIRDVS